MTLKLGMRLVRMLHSKRVYTDQQKLTHRLQLRKKQGPRQGDVIIFIVVLKRRLCGKLRRYEQNY